MAINNMTYKNGKLYCIRNTIDDDIYVGSTTQLLCKRMVHHRSDMHRHLQMKVYIKMRELGVEHFYIELIENCPCETKAELCKREGYFIREMATLNGKVMGRTHKEYYQEFNSKFVKYREEHKDEMKEKKREYRITHKEQIKEYDKKRNEENRELIKQRLTKLVICECGKQITYHSKFKHIKTKIQQQLMNELSLSSSPTLSD